MPYTPGSPFSSWEPVADGGRHPNGEDHGTTHLWEQWNEKDCTTYRGHAPRFDVPDSIDDRRWATSLVQARAVRLGAEHFRSLSPQCSGSTSWQLNDCWPVTSWSVVDGDGRLKPAWYALRAAHADLLLTIQPRAGGLTLVVANDTDEALERRVEVVRAGFGGDVLAAAALDVSVGERSTVEVALPAGVVTPRSTSPLRRSSTPRTSSRARCCAARTSWSPMPGAPEPRRAGGGSWLALAGSSSAHRGPARYGPYAST